MVGIGACSTVLYSSLRFEREREGEGGREARCGWRGDGWSGLYVMSIGRGGFEGFRDGVSWGERRGMRWDRGSLL